MQQIAPRKNPLAYGLDVNTTAALAILCLVSRAFYDLASPRLYHSVIVKDERQLLSLSRTIRGVPDLAGHLHSVSMRDFANPNFEFVSTASLAPAAVDALAHLVRAPGLRRMVLDSPLRVLRPENDEHGVRAVLRDAFDAARLVEFTSIKCELFLAREEVPDKWYECWPRWTGLERLSLFNPDVNAEFVGAVGALPQLTHVVLHYVDWSGEHAAQDLVDMLGPRMRRFVEIERGPAAYIQAYTIIEEAVKLAPRRGIEIALCRTEGREATMRWIQRLAEDGMLWELEVGNRFSTAATYRT